MRPRLACLLAAALLGTAPEAHAQDARAPPPSSAPPPVAARELVHAAGHLDFTLGAGTERCPHEDMLHTEVARRIGYDAFARDAKGPPFGQVHVTIARAPGGLAATYSYDDPGGVRRWTKTYPVSGTSAADCEVAISGVAVVLADELVIFSYQAPAVPAPVPELAAPAPTAEPAPSEALPAAPPPPRPTGSSLHPRFELGLGVLGSIGTGPHVTVGGALHAGVAIAPFGSERAWLLFAGEGRVDGAATDAYGVQSQLFAGSLVVCGDREVDAGRFLTVGFLGCLVGTVGALHLTAQARGNGSVTYTPTYAAAGARLGLDLRLGSVVALRPQIEVLPTLAPARKLINDHVESVAGVTGSAGLAAVFLF